MMTIGTVFLWFLIKTTAGGAESLHDEHVLTFVTVWSPQLNRRVCYHSLTLSRLYLWNDHLLFIGLVVPNAVIKFHHSIIPHVFVQDVPRQYQPYTADDQLKG